VVEAAGVEPVKARPKAEADLPDIGADTTSERTP